MPKPGELAALTVGPAALEGPLPVGMGLAPLEVHAATIRTALAKRTRTRVTDIENAPR
jgi:hypothetical protein